MLRYLFLISVLSSSLVAFGQTTAKPACTMSATQCQKARTSTTMTQQSATPARTVANQPTETAATPKPACTYRASACQGKSTSTAATTTATTVKATTVAQKDRASAPSILAIPGLPANCDPSNCDPKNCRPTNCNTSSTSTTQLAVKQE